MKFAADGSILRSLSNKEEEMLHMSEKPIIAVIGGTGLYQFTGLEEIQVLEIDTPFGRPSAPLIIGTLANNKVVFLARHGIGHHIIPSEVNYRANIYALKSLGVERIVGVSACGSLRDDYAPGHVIIPDQLIDFTRQRARTFFGESLVAHVSMPDPFCPSLSSLAYQALTQCNIVTHQGSIAITIEGPRFSTRAESHLFRAWGASIINMTTCPEAFLAREAEMCYTSIAHVTDYDAWHTTEEPVTIEMVIQTLNRNTTIIQEALRKLIETLPTKDDCACRHSLEKAIITDPEKISPETRKKLNLLVNKYLPV